MLLEAKKEKESYSLHGRMNINTHNLKWIIYLKLSPQYKIEEHGITKSNDRCKV